MGRWMGDIAIVKRCSRLVPMACKYTVIATMTNLEAIFEQYRGSVKTW